MLSSKHKFQGLKCCASKNVAMQWRCINFRQIYESFSEDHPGGWCVWSGILHVLMLRRPMLLLCPYINNSKANATSAHLPQGWYSNADLWLKSCFSFVLPFKKFPLFLVRSLISKNMSQASSTVGSLFFFLSSFVTLTDLHHIFWWIDFFRMSRKIDHCVSDYLTQHPPSKGILIAHNTRVDKYCSVMGPTGTGKSTVRTR